MYVYGIYRVYNCDLRRDYVRDRGKGETLTRTVTVERVCRKAHLDTLQVITIDRRVSKYLYAEEYFILIAITSLQYPAFRRVFEETLRSGVQIWTIDEKWKLLSFL